MSDDRRPSFEASTLGWRPGHWPTYAIFPGVVGEFKFDYFVKDAEGDIQYARYYSDEISDYIVTVFND